MRRPLAAVLLSAVVCGGVCASPPGAAQTPNDRDAAGAAATTATAVDAPVPVVAANGEAAVSGVHHEASNPLAVADIDTGNESSVDATDDADTASALRWSGTASGALLAGSGSRDLDDTGARLGAAARLRSELRGESWRALIEAVGGTRQLAYDDAPVLRQGFAEYTAGRVQLRAGRQIVVWGRADRLNPTDNLSPRNLRALVSDIDEDRIGTDLLSARLQVNERWSLAALHIPRLRASVLPASLWKPIDSLHGDRLRAPSATDALRLDYAGNGLDASLSAVQGYSVLPAFDYTSAAQLAQTQVRVLGADFSASLGERWGLRGELAHTRFDRAPPGLGDSFYAVLGVERHFDGGWLGLAQYVHRRVEREPVSVALPAFVARANRAIWFQSRTRSDALYLGLTRAPLEGDLSGDVGVLQTLDDSGRAWFANLEYRLDDHWSVLARWQHFRGPNDSDLGALRKDTLALLELRRTWGWQQ